jgi:hypothetical protein
MDTLICQRRATFQTAKQLPCPFGLYPLAKKVIFLLHSVFIDFQNIFIFPGAIWTIVKKI